MTEQRNSEWFGSLASLPAVSLGAGRVRRMVFVTSVAVAGTLFETHGRCPSCGFEWTETPGAVSAASGRLMRIGT